MELNYQDHEIMKFHIQQYLKYNKHFMKPVELIVRPECNQQCEYCYMYKHGDELYPKEKRISKEQILKNIEILLNYLVENQIVINQWELFAGDLFYDNIWFDIMDIFYKYFKYIRENNLLDNNEDIEIVTPSNFSFCNSDTKISLVKNYIAKFQNDLKAFLYLSYSSDGKYATDIREKKEISDEFFNKVFSLMACYNWQAHPMISYENIDNAIKNYDWWIEQFKKYQCTTFTHKIPLLLEVRNAGWTSDAIKKYLKLLEHMIWHRYQLCNNDIETFTKHLFFPIPYLKEHNIICPNPSLDPLKLIYYSTKDNFMHCTLGYFLCINCADLSFVPCHRTSYSFFTGGKFTVKDDKIIGIEATEGINGYFNQKVANIMFNPDCYTCENKFFCMKGCRGAQFEYNQETYLPIPDVCNLLNNKLTFLLQMYDKLGVFHYLFTQNEYILPIEYKQALIKILKLKGMPEYEYKYC